MAEVVLFHHVQGLTDGVRAFTEAIRADGHTVHTPDLFDGEQPATIDDGIRFTQAIGGAALRERADRAVSGLSSSLVYAGFSSGAGEAQRLAQTRPGARGALLYESCIPITGDWAFGPWPAGVPVQIHGMDHDPIFALEVELAELYTYPGDGHLFTDSSLPAYDATAAATVIQRSREFLTRT